MKNLLLISCALLVFTSLGACSASEDAQVEQAILEDEAPTQPKNAEKTVQTHAAQIDTGYKQVPVQKRAKGVASRPEVRAVTPPVPPVQSKEAITASVVPNLPPTYKAIPFNMRRCMNLGNALEAPKEGDWGYTIRNKDFAILKAAGFDTVRIPIKWDAHAARRAPYQIEPLFMARVQQIVSGAQANGLGVIIDIHHYETLMRQPAREQARFLAIWDQIARNFSRQPSNVYFEVLNEPTLEINMAQLNVLYAKVVPIIRASNPTRKIIIGGNSWNSVESMSEVQWPKDPNIVATFHDYGPHEFTHQGAEWSEPVMPMGRKWGGRADQREMKDTYAVARAFVKKTGLPILVGEFGVIDKVPLAERTQWMKARRKTMEAHGYAWCAWDYSGAFSTYDISKEAWKPGVLAALTRR